MRLGNKLQVTHSLEVETAQNPHPQSLETAMISLPLSSCYRTLCTSQSLVLMRENGVTERKENAWKERGTRIGKGKSDPPPPPPPDTHTLL